MNTCRATGILLTLVLSWLPLSSPSHADDWDWPEKPQDLQVLPKDWPGSRLRPVMSGFSRALGVTCSHCHVGEAGKPRSTYDFASNANPNKNRARAMLEMLGDINDSLDKIEPSGDKRVNMWCHTCHRGRPRPMTLGEELAEAYRAGSRPAAMTRYQELKEKFYGKGAYSFSDSALNDLGYEILGAGDLAGAIVVFRRNTEEYPESANAWDSLGEAYLKAGDGKRAEASYAKSLELDPENENAVEKLEELRRQAGE